MISLLASYGCWLFLPVGRHEWFSWRSYFFSCQLLAHGLIRTFDSNSIMRPPRLNSPSPICLAMRQSKSWVLPTTPRVLLRAPPHQPQLGLGRCTRKRQGRRRRQRLRWVPERIDRFSPFASNDLFVTIMWLISVGDLWVMRACLVRWSIGSSLRDPWRTRN